MASEDIRLQELINENAKIQSQKSQANTLTVSWAMGIVSGLAVVALFFGFLAQRYLGTEVIQAQAVVATQRANEARSDLETERIKEEGRKELLQLLKGVKPR